MERIELTDYVIHRGDTGEGGGDGVALIWLGPTCEIPRDAVVTAAGGGLPASVSRAKNWRLHCSALTLSATRWRGRKGCMSSGRPAQGCRVSGFPEVLTLHRIGLGEGLPSPARWLRTAARLRR